MTQEQHILSALRHISSPAREDVPSVSEIKMAMRKAHLVGTLSDNQLIDQCARVARTMMLQLANTPAEDAPDPDAEVRIETCKGCYYWNQTSLGDPHNKPRGQCRIKPPFVTAPNEGFREWPITEDADWCGEWRAGAAKMGGRG